MSKGVHESIECARHRSVYTVPYVFKSVPCTVKGSRVCKPCNVLNVKDVSMYVFSTV